MRKMSKKMKQPAYNSFLLHFLKTRFTNLLKIRHWQAAKQKLCFYPMKVPLLPCKTIAFTR